MLSRNWKVPFWKNGTVQRKQNQASLLATRSPKSKAQDYKPGLFTQLSSSSERLSNRNNQTRSFGFWRVFTMKEKRPKQVEKSHSKQTENTKDRTCARNRNWYYQRNPWHRNFYKVQLKKAPLDKKMIEEKNSTEFPARQKCPELPNMISPL